jgi:hypothetical protein
MLAILFFIDRNLEAVFVRALNRFCKWTGRSNFFFARAAWLGGLMVSIPLITWLGVVNFIYDLLATLWIMGIYFKIIRRAEITLRSGESDVYPFTDREVRVSRLFAVFLVLFALVYIAWIGWRQPADAVLIAARNIFIVSSIYFMLHARPKTKEHRPHMPRIALP